MAITQTDIETFGLFSLKKHLRQITKSKNYTIELEGNTIFFKFYTKKYLTILDKREGRNYTIINHFSTENSHDELELLHSLIICYQIKNMKEDSMPLHTFIEEVIKWVGMCISLITYNYSLKGNQNYLSRTTYNLPYNIKEEIYNYMKKTITNIKYGVYTDGEENSYNSCSIEESYATGEYIKYL